MKQQMDENVYKASFYPKRLPCNHVFPEKFLRDFIAIGQYEKCGCFPCPMCKLDVVIPIDGIEHFDCYTQYTHAVQPLSNVKNKAISLKKPFGLTCTSNNIVALTDKEDNRLLLFTLGLELVSCFDFKSKIGGLAAFDVDSLLITNDNINLPLLVKLNLDGTKAGFFDTLDKMVPTNGVTWLKNSRKIVVSSVETATLYVLDESGRLICKHSGKALLGDPYFLSSNSYNEIIVSDHLNHFIKVLDCKGNIKYQMGGSGNKNANLFQPKGICVDKNDNIIVADSGNRCVKCFSRFGKFLRVLACCTNPETIPIGVALSQNDDYLIVLLMANPPKIEVLEYIPPR